MGFVKRPSFPQRLETKRFEYITRKKNCLVGVAAIVRPPRFGPAVPDSSPETPTAPKSMPEIDIFAACFVRFW
jgi:hypothetical protein